MTTGGAEVPVITERAARFAEGLGIRPDPDDYIAIRALNGMMAPQDPNAAPPPPPRPRRLGEVPACWAWEFDPTTPRGTLTEQAVRLDRWQDGRCAVCGCGDAAVDDHDHSTGLTRGYLCRSCNHAEAVSGLQVYALYRWRHPTSILGLTLPYTGLGWRGGAPVSSVPGGMVQA